MTRMVSQILWEHCMGELGYSGNDYENDTFAVRSYNWVDEDANDWHFWHKPSGLKVQWYKYPLRGFEANMEITDDQFLDVLRDCTNSIEDGKRFKVLHEVRRWWADRKTEPTISKMEQVDKDINVRSKDEQSGKERVDADR